MGKEPADRLIAIAGLPPVGRARLPESYALARTALETCERVDECRKWGDHMAALASYARQTNDNELIKMAMRIQARAARRVGELLAKIKPQNGARTDRKPGVGSDTKLLSRTRAARDAGISKEQQMRAMRVAKIPAQEFELMIEGDDPPSVSELADGKRAPRVSVKSLIRDDAPDGAIPAATGALGMVWHMTRRAAELDLELAVKGMARRERDDALRHIADCERILARFRKAIDEENERHPQ